MSTNRGSAYDRLRQLEQARATRNGEIVRAPLDDEPFGEPGLPDPPAPTRPSEDEWGMESLERRFFGAPAEDLSLRDRLQRLADSAGRTVRHPTRPRAAALEELVQGQRVANAAGEFFLIESQVPLDSFQGSVPLSRLRLAGPSAPRLLTGDASLEDFPLHEAVFLDTETTGLAGGTGTAAFLIGVGFVDGEHFRVRQYFMRDYHEEAALLHALAEELARFRYVVTFNGKLFDVPLLETRYRLCRRAYPLGQAPHLDLLHPARRLWKARLGSCRLIALEAGLLNLHRQGDVPGELIPSLYFDYVRRRDAVALVKVFEHNRTDIVSLAALAGLACQWVEQELAEEPLDWLSLGRLFERGGEPERAGRAYLRTVEGAERRPRVQARLRLATLARRAGDWSQAHAHWQAAASDRSWRACRDLAVFHEHRVRQPEAALLWAERGLALLEGREGPRVHEGRRDLHGRIGRLRRRMATLATSAATPGTRPTRGSRPAS